LQAEAIIDFADADKHNKNFSARFACDIGKIGPPLADEWRRC
jgi:hypothetical protein